MSLLQLPPELRLKIYTLVFADNCIHVRSLLPQDPPSSSGVGQSRRLIWTSNCRCSLEPQCICQSWPILAGYQLTHIRGPGLFFASRRLRLEVLAVARTAKFCSIHFDTDAGEVRDYLLSLRHERCEDVCNMITHLSFSSVALLEHQKNKAMYR